MVKRAPSKRTRVKKSEFPEMLPPYQPKHWHWPVWALLGLVFVFLGAAGFYYWPTNTF